MPHHIGVAIRERVQHLQNRFLIAVNNEEITDSQYKGGLYYALHIVTGKESFVHIHPEIAEENSMRVDYKILRELSIPNVFTLLFKISLGWPCLIFENQWQRRLTAEILIAIAYLLVGVANAESILQFDSSTVLQHPGSSTSSRTPEIYIYILALVIKARELQQYSSATQIGINDLHILLDLSDHFQLTTLHRSDEIFQQMKKGLMFAEENIDYTSDQYIFLMLEFGHPSPYKGVISEYRKPKIRSFIKDAKESIFLKERMILTQVAELERLGFKLI